MKNLKYILIFILFIIIFAVFFKYNNFKGLESLPVESKPNPSVYNDKPSGLSQFYRLLHNLNFKTGIIDLKNNDIEKVNGLIFINESNNDLNENGIDKVFDWVKQGNAIICFTDSLSSNSFKYFYKKLNIVSNQIFLDNEVQFYFNLKHKLNNLRNLHSYQIVGHEELAKIIKPLKFNPFENIDYITIKSDSFLFDKLPPDKKTLLRYGTSLHYFFKIFKINNGLIFIISDPSFISNMTLIDDRCFNNYQFILNIINGLNKPVYFDENLYFYSSNAKSILSYLWMDNFKLITIQLIIITVLGLMSGWQRFGMIYELPQDRILNRLEYVNNMAAFLEFHKQYKYVLETISHNFTSKICSYYNIPYNSSLQELKDNYHIIDNKDLCELLTNINELLEDKNITKEQLIAIVNLIDEFDFKLTSNSFKNYSIIS